MKTKPHTNIFTVLRQSSKYLELRILMTISRKNHLAKIKMNDKHFLTSNLSLSLRFQMSNLLAVVMLILFV
jgi:hypothetical protein